MINFLKIIKQQCSDWIWEWKILLRLVIMDWSYAVKQLWENSKIFLMRPLAASNNKQKSGMRGEEKCTHAIIYFGSI